MTVIYLHGFASGATSSKATFVGRQLRARGVHVEIPDLNLPDFSTLTITRMLGQVGALIGASPEPVVLIGSSLGAYVAVNAALQQPGRVQKMVLMAPALDFNRAERMGPTRVADWKAAGAMNVFHFGYGRIVPVHYALYEDARQYDAMHADVTMPVLVFQGRRDDAVDPHTVEEWCRARPNVELHMLDDGHQLTASLSYMWDVTSRFLGIPPGSSSDRP